MKDTLVIDIFSGSSCGKTTVASDLYRLMKQQGMDVELTKEVATDLIHDEQFFKLNECQDWVTAEQNYRLKKLIGKYKYVISDSPVLLGIFYVREGFLTTYESYAREVFDQYNHFNIFLERNPEIPYNINGRVHTYEEALVKDKQIYDYLKVNKLLHLSVMSDTNAAHKILNAIQ